MGDHKEEVIFDHLIIVNDCMALGKKIFIYVVNFLKLSMNIFIVFFRCLVFKSALKLVCYVLQLGIIGKKYIVQIILRKKTTFYTFVFVVIFQVYSAFAQKEYDFCIFKGTVQRDFRPPVFFIIRTGLTH